MVIDLISYDKKSKLSIILETNKKSQIISSIIEIYLKNNLNSNMLEINFEINKGWLMEQFRVKI